MKQILYRMLQSIIFITVTVLVSLSVLLYLFQPKFIYFPYTRLETTPSTIQLNYEDIYITTEDNINIHGWYIPHDKPRATLLFLHGNAGNISHRLDSLAIFHSLALSVLIIDYRGYGQSDGKPSEQGTYKDAIAAWNYLLEDKGLPGNDIIIFGRSLGAAVATWLATQYQPKALILESAFTSIQDMGKHYYPYLPVELLTRIKYLSIDRINKINCPVLFIHSPTDDIVPYKLGRQLFENANDPKIFLDIKGGHNDGFFISGKLYTNGLNNFLSTYIDR